MKLEWQITTLLSVFMASTAIVWGSYNLRWQPQPHYQVLTYKYSTVQLQHLVRVEPDGSVVHLASSDESKPFLPRESRNASDKVTDGNE